MNASNQNTRLSMIVVYVADLDAAVAFYVDAIGLTVRQSYGSYMALDCGEGASVLGLARLPEDRTAADVGRSVMKIVFFTDDATESARRAVEAGGELVEAPAPRDDLPYVIGFVRDLDGHLVELISPQAAD